MAKEDPIFGKGFDQFHSLVPSYVPGFYEGSTGDATDNQNMFLYAASNMGVPSLITLLLIIGALAFRGWSIYKKSTVDIDRIIGLGAVTLVAGLVAVNMFGTHIIDTSVDVFLWIYIAIVPICLIRNNLSAPKTEMDNRDKILSSHRPHDRRTAARRCGNAAGRFDAPAHTGLPLHHRLPDQGRPA
jgi:hypothetical protein